MKSTCSETSRLSNSSLLSDAACSTASGVEMSHLHPTLLQDNPALSHIYLFTVYLCFVIDKGLPFFLSPVFVFLS